MSGNLIFNIFLQFQAEYNPLCLADSASSPVHFVAEDACCWVASVGLVCFVGDYCGVDVRVCGEG